MTAGHRHAGMALIEALVALVLLSAGLGVAAGMTLQTLRHTREAAQRLVAVRLAESLAEELRALRRRDGRAARAAAGEDPAVACADAPESCAVERAVAEAVSEWRRRLAACLPSGVTGNVELPDAAVAAYVIRIEWPQAGVAGSASVALPVET